MATADNSFQFNQDVVWDNVDSYANTLATSAYAIPFKDFDYNPKNGMSYRLNYPVRQIAEDGLEYDPDDMQNLFQRFRTINLNITKNVTFPITADQISYKAGAGTQEEFSKMYLSPGARALGEKVNTATMDELMMNFTDTIGDPSQPLNGITTMSAINTMFSNMGLSHFGEKYFQLSPNSTSAFQTPYVTYFNQGFNQDILTKDTTTFSKDYSGVMPYVDQSYVTIDNGQFDTGAVGAITVSIAPPADENINAEYSVLTLTGFADSATDVLKRGNRIKFTDATRGLVQQLNPGTYKKINNPKYFVIVEDVDADEDGVAEIKVFPPIVSASTDQYRNVSRAVVVGDTVQILGTRSTSYTLNFAFVKQAIQFANPPIGTYILQSGQTNFGGFPFQQIMREKLPNSEMTIGFNLSASGNHPMFSNVISLRTIAAAAAFNEYGFGVASSL